MGHALAQAAANTQQQHDISTQRRLASRAIMVKDAR